MDNLKIIEMQFGSHVYGTNVPTSDHDYKSIFIPTARDILLQAAPRTITQHSKKDPNQKNTSEDVDIESFSFHTYLDLLAQNQTVALDMFFSPKEFFIGEVHPLWWEIKSHADKFLNKQSGAFLGYARRQAAKYGIKGSRVAAMRSSLEFLKALPRHEERLLNYDAFIVDFVNQQNNEYIKIVELQNNKTFCRYFEVCNRKIPMTNNVKKAIEIFQMVFDEYGQRALQAEKNEGIDWKATMHAVRVAHQAKELLLTGHVTFPRPEAPLLLKIRKGELPYKEVSEMIEQGLVDVLEAQEKSSLRNEPDHEFIKDFICDVYGWHVYLDQKMTRNL